MQRLHLFTDDVSTVFLFLLCVCEKNNVLACGHSQLTFSVFIVLLQSLKNTNDDFSNKQKI